MSAISKSEFEVKHNAKIKIYDNDFCTLTAFNRDIYLEPGYERSDKDLRAAAKAKAKAEKIKNLFEMLEAEEPPTEKPRERADSIRRSKNAVFDISYANKEEWQYMVTLTINGDNLNRYNPDEIIKPFQNWLKNCVKRKGLKALLVPEYHNDKAIHFHGLVNGALTVCDSGTVIAPKHKKPIKVATAKRQGIKLEECKTVYNCPDWKFGFSTFVPLDENMHSVCNYVTKYVTKEFSKIFGKSYFAVGDIKRQVPSCLYDINFTELTAGGGESDKVRTYSPYDKVEIAYFTADLETVLQLVNSVSR